MSPDFYANEYKRYQCFCKNYGNNKLYKVACGPSGEDYNWTKELMSRIDHEHANGISLHYYTVPGDWEHKGSATDFSDEEYYITISKALHIEDIIEKHLAIMNTTRTMILTCLWMNGVPGTMWNRAPIRDFYISRTPCGMPLSLPPL